MKDARTQLWVAGHTRDGHRVKIPVWKRIPSNRGADWKTFEFPRSTQLTISVFSPVHGLAERVLDVGPTQDVQTLEIDLGGHVNHVSPQVTVLLPPGSPDSAMRFHVNLMGPKTRHVIHTWRIEYLSKEIQVPPGEYVFETRGITSIFCGNEPPTAEWYVPAAAPWSVEQSEPITLAPKLGSRLELKVKRPRAARSRVEPERRKPEPGSLEPWPSESDHPSDLVAIQLKSIETSRVHDLTWGWSGLYFFTPRSHFPMGKDAYQIVPVPPGDYELILRGIGIEELRHRVTLVPGSSNALVLEPEHRGR